MSRFVSAGTEETERDEAWLKAEEELEAKRREKAAAANSDGKSLYETLQANKAAKQEQFEESIRLRNQFRSLDEDEVEFLDSVLESTRAKEAAVKKQTAEELDAFRRQQEEAEKAAKSAESPDAPETTETTSWTVGKKRKKGREDILGAVKLRKSSTSDKAPPGSTSPPTEASKQQLVKEVGTAKASPAKAAGDGEAPSVEKEASPRAAQPAPNLGLAAYSSDEDE